MKVKGYCLVLRSEGCAQSSLRVKSSFLRNHSLVWKRRNYLEVGENSFPVGSEATCLGYQWRQDLPSTPMVQDRIQRARKAFFQFGSAFAFQSKPSPISSSSIVETCVLPIVYFLIPNVLYL